MNVTTTALEHAIAGAFGAHEGDRYTEGDLASIDGFHTRARQATAELAALAGLRRDMHVLHIGAGLGGVARHLAATHGVRVTGLEALALCVRAARMLTASAGLADRVVFERGSPLAAPFATATFDRVWLQHVLLKIADKARLFAEARRVLVAGDASPFTKWLHPAAAMCGSHCRGPAARPQGSCRGRNDYGPRSKTRDSSCRSGVTRLCSRSSGVTSSSSAPTTTRAFSGGGCSSATRHRASSAASRRTLIVDVWAW